MTKTGIIKRITVGVAAITMLGLAACNGNFLSNTSNLASILTSAQGQAFINALGTTGTLIPGIQQVLSDIDSGVSKGSATALNTVCFALPWADGALDLFAPNTTVDPSIVTQTDAAVAAFVNGPCKTPPQSLAQAIQQGANLFMTIQNSLHSNGVPVAIPTTAVAH